MGERPNVPALRVVGTMRLGEEVQQLGGGRLDPAAVHPGADDGPPAGLMLCRTYSSTRPPWPGRSSTRTSTCSPRGREPVAPAPPAGRGAGDDGRRGPPPYPELLLPDASGQVSGVAATSDSQTSRRRDRPRRRPRCQRTSRGGPYGYGGGQGLRGCPSRVGGVGGWRRRSRASLPSPCSSAGPPMPITAGSPARHPPPRRRRSNRHKPRRIHHTPRSRPHLRRPTERQGHRGPWVRQGGVDGEGAAQTGAGIAGVAESPFSIWQRPIGPCIRLPWQRVRMVVSRGCRPRGR